MRYEELLIFINIKNDYYNVSHSAKMQLLRHFSAEVESRVFIISFNSFKKAFEAHPEHLTKVIQVVMVR